MRGSSWCNPKYLRMEQTECVSCKGCYVVWNKLWSRGMFDIMYSWSGIWEISNSANDPCVYLRRLRTRQWSFCYMWTMSSWLRPLWKQWRWWNDAFHVISTWEISKRKEASWVCRLIEISKQESCVSTNDGTCRICYDDLGRVSSKVVRMMSIGPIRSVHSGVKGSRNIGLVYRTDSKAPLVEVFPDADSDSWMLC